MMDKDDPRLTAYALGELDAAEVAAVEAALADDAEAQAEVAAIRQMAAVLRETLAGEAAPLLTDEQRQAIRARAIQGPRPARRRALRLLSWSAAAAAALLVTCIALPRLLHRQRADGERTLALQVEGGADRRAPAAETSALDEWGYGPKSKGESTRPVKVLTEARAEPGPGIAPATPSVALPAPATPTPAVAPSPTLPASAGRRAAAAADEVARKPAPDAERTERAAEAATVAAGQAPAIVPAKEQEPAAAGGAFGAPGGAPGRRDDELQAGTAITTTGAAGGGMAGAPGLLPVTPGEPARAKAAGAAAGEFLAGLGRPGAAPGGTDGKLDADAVAKPVEAKVLYRAPDQGAAAPEALAVVGRELKGDFAERPEANLGKAVLARAREAEARDDALPADSYNRVRRLLNEGQLPPPQVVHLNALVNSFQYQDQPPAGEQPLAVRTEVATCPWKPVHQLVRVAVKGRPVDTDGRVVVGGVVLRQAMVPAAKAASAARVIAREAVLLVDFVPARVSAFRRLADEGLAAPAPGVHDRQNLGDLPAGYSLSSFYEIVPINAQADLAVALAARREQARRVLDAAPATAELLTVTLRWTQPESGRAQVLAVRVPDQVRRWEETSEDMRFAGAVALFGMNLLNSPEAARAGFRAVLDMAAPTLANQQDLARNEFVDLVRKAEVLQTARTATDRAAGERPAVPAATAAPAP